MCGLAGYFNKATKTASVGKTIISMLQALGCRGPDSAGVALFATPHNGLLILNIKLGEVNQQTAARQLKETVESQAHIDQFTVCADYVRIAVTKTGDWKDLVSAIESIDENIEVVSVGRSLEIVKQVGAPSDLETQHNISGFTGSHSLGHTRLSTESRVDLSHSQPFWGHAVPDIAAVHNGHITNYHQLRRRYEQRGTKFYTENDSEVVAIYLGQQLGKGMSLEASLQSLISEVDGSYCCIVATESEFGFVKDPFGFKPLTFTETEDFVAVATEEQAIRSAIDGDYAVREAGVKEVRVWQR